jgi:ABC-2 type transport system ATP-binding protein
MHGVAIETTGICKSFGSVLAVDEVDWMVAEGSISGMVGPNGAGKTTLLKMLLGITQPTSGSARVMGFDSARDSVEIRQRTGFVPEDKLLYDNVPVGSFLRFVGSFYPTWDADEAQRLLTRWRIPLGRKIRALSKGMRGKLVFTVAMARRPRLLLLDEPTMDLDAGSVEEILSMIAGWVAEEGRTAVLATHRLEEVERICDRVSLIDEGRQVLTGDLDDIKTGWKRITAYGQLPESILSRISGVRERVVSREITRLVVEGFTPDLLALLRHSGADDVEVQGMNLREIFLALTSESRDPGAGSEPGSELSDPPMDEVEGGGR